jgi:hypothetical protein
MAHDGHIHRENYGFIGANGLALAPAESHSLDFHLRNLGSMARGIHTLETTLKGCILEFTYLEGPVPSLVAGHDQVSRLRNQRTTAHDELT